MENMIAFFYVSVNVKLAIYTICKWRSVVSNQVIQLIRDH